MPGGLYFHKWPGGGDSVVMLSTKRLDSYPVPPNKPKGIIFNLTYRVLWEMIKSCPTRLEFKGTATYQEIPYFSLYHVALFIRCQSFVVVVVWGYHR